MCRVPCDLCSIDSMSNTVTGPLGATQARKVVGRTLTDVRGVVGLKGRGWYSYCAPRLHCENSAARHGTLGTWEVQAVAMPEMYIFFGRGRLEAPTEVDSWRPAAVVKIGVGRDVLVKLIDRRRGPAQGARLSHA